MLGSEDRARLEWSENQRGHGGWTTYLWGTIDIRTVLAVEAYMACKVDFGKIHRA